KSKPFSRLGKASGGTDTTTGLNAKCEGLLVAQTISSVSPVCKPPADPSFTTGKACLLIFKKPKPDKASVAKIFALKVPPSPSNTVASSPAGNPAAGVAIKPSLVRITPEEVE